MSYKQDVIDYLEIEYELNKALAEELVERRKSIIIYCQEMRSFPYYAADEIMRAEDKNLSDYEKKS